jgi:II/X family phage/plasmid replication protein
MVQMATTQECRDFISLLSHNARSHRSKWPVTTRKTLYFGKDSKRWTLKLYVKTDEHQAGGHRLPMALPSRGQLLGWVESMLRIELTLRGKELVKLDLAKAQQWNATVAQAQLKRVINTIVIQPLAALPSETIAGLTPCVRDTYELWKCGVDPRDIHGERTYQDRRRKLLKEGIDISVPWSVDFDQHSTPPHICTLETWKTLGAGVLRLWKAVRHWSYSPSAAPYHLFPVSDRLMT